MPGASFEDLFPLAEDAAEVFSQCCDSVAEDCMQKKVGEPGAQPKNHLPSHSTGLESEPHHGEGVRSLTNPGRMPSPAHPLAPLFAVIGAHGQSLRRAVGPR